MVEKVKDDLIERQIVSELHPSGFVLHIQEDTAFILTKLHEGAHIILRGINAGKNIRLFHRLNFAYGREVGGVVNVQFLTVCFVNFIDNIGDGGDEVKVKLSLQTFLDNLHME